MCLGSGDKREEAMEVKMEIRWGRRILRMTGKRKGRGRREGGTRVGARIVGKGRKRNGRKKGEGRKKGTERS